jgi:hypothetical protein
VSWNHDAGVQKSILFAPDDLFMNGVDRVYIECRLGFQEGNSGSKENIQMRKIFGLLILCAVALMAAANPFVGTWKLNVAKSKFSPGPPLQSQTVTIGADNKVEVSGTDSEGQAVNWSYTATPGTATITGLPDASVMETRKGNTLDHTWIR